MNVNRMNQSNIRMHIAVFASLVSLVGCADNVGAPVNIDAAQQILITVMDAWKDGTDPEDLKEAKPPIVVQEAEWANGAKLTEYEVLSDDQPAGPNLVATVKLKLTNPDGKAVEKTATYIVTTSPSRTVYRNTMR